MRRRLTYPLVVLVALLCAGPAHAQEVKVSLTVLGFTADAAQMLVQLDDDTVGTQLMIYDTATGQPAKKAQRIVFQRGESQQVIRDTRKKAKITDPGLEDTLYPQDPADPENVLSFFGLMATKERFVLAVTDRQRLGKIADIAVRRDTDAGIWAKVALKSLWWTGDRRLLVAVVTQKLVADGVRKEIDEVHAFPFQVQHIRWVEPEPPQGHAPDGRPPEEKKPWWKLWG